jgi:hypothetical protein
VLFNRDKNYEPVCRQSIQQCRLACCSTGTIPFFYPWLKEQYSAIDSFFIYTQATEAILVELGKEGEILRQSTQQIYTLLSSVNNVMHLLI